MIYAQINDDNICIGISQLSGAVSSSNMILIGSLDQSLIGQKYENGEWAQVEPEPSVPEPPTDQELIQAELLLNQTKILINQEQQDTVLAELLLNQIGGI